MANRLVFFLLLSLLPIGAGLMGCAVLQGDSGRVGRLQEDTEILEVRLTNFEERLTLVEQEVGVLRSQVIVPEGARRVDPAPSLAKFPNLAASEKTLFGEGTVVPSVSPARHDVRPSATATSQQAPVLVPPQGSSALLAENAYAQSATIQPGAIPSVPIQTATSQSGPIQPELVLSGPSQSEPAVPALIHPDKQALSSAPDRVQVPAVRSGGHSVSPIPTVAGTPASLRGLPSSFRTGVRAYDEALAMYYRHEYAKSRQAFADFIENNKNHKLLPNALYWQGENAYSQADYLSAILSFQTITSTYPQHSKAADALLKIGMSYERLKDPGNAQFYWQVLLDDYPKSSAARVARKNMRR